MAHQALVLVEPSDPCAGSHASRPDAVFFLMLYFMGCPGSPRDDWPLNIEFSSDMLSQLIGMVYERVSPQALANTWGPMLFLYTFVAPATLAMLTAKEKFLSGVLHCLFRMWLLVQT